MPTTLRPATAADQGTVKAMVRGAGLNPLDLKWQRFLLAELDGRVVGIGQVRHHGDGSRELASLVVEEALRGQGIGEQLVYALMAREQGPVYLFCQNLLETYYARFGFTAATREGLPPKLRRWHRMGNLMASLATRLGHDPFRIVVMVAQAPLSGGAMADAVAEARPSPAA